MKRVIKINAELPKTVTVTIAIVPFGLYLNKTIQEAQRGSIIEFCDQWRKGRYTLLHKRKVAVESVEFARLRTLIYGEYVSTASLFDRWEAEALVNGYGRNAFDKEQVLYLELEKIE